MRDTLVLQSHSLYKNSYSVTVEGTKQELSAPQRHRLLAVGHLVCARLADRFVADYDSRMLFAPRTSEGLLLIDVTEVGRHPARRSDVAELCESFWQELRPRSEDAQQ